MTTVHDPLGPPILRTPEVRVTKTGEAYTVDTKTGVGAWKIATIAALPAGSLVQLPNGLSYGPSAKALLTADEAALISASAIPGTVASVVDVTAIVIVPKAPNDLSLKLTAPIDLTTQLQVTAGASGPLVPASDVRWSSAVPAAAKVSQSGLVTAVAVHAGVVITAQWNGLSDTETIVVVA